MTELTNTVVVGYDSSPESELALDWATARAGRTGELLRIVYVIPMETPIGLMPPGMPWPMVEPDEIDVNSLPAVQRARATLGDARVEAAAVTGNPAGTLVDASASADLVVVGTRGRGALAAGLFGSTTYAVAGHCACPVAVVRAPKDTTVAPKPDSDHPVVVGIEDLDVSAKVLRFAADIAGRNNALLKIVRVTQHAPVGDLGAGFSPAPIELEESMTAHDEHALAECAEQVRLSHPKVEVEQVRLHGDPAHCLTDEAEDAGMIVIGSRGRGGFAGLLLGSVTHSVIHLAHCPVVVVR